MTTIDTHTVDVVTTALNGIRTECEVEFEVTRMGHVNIFDHEEWQGTFERGGYVRVTDAIVVEDLPAIAIVSVHVDGMPVTIDDTQRKLIAYQVVNGLPKTEEYYTGIAE